MKPLNRGDAKTRRNRKSLNAKTQRPEDAEEILGLPAEKPILDVASFASALIFAGPVRSQAGKVGEAKPEGDIINGKA